ncbi:MAG TPA: HNH endonuclease signature motif containing protein [Polyangiaceae bacterium]|nr:HNH endonuclease signature motif containing protein [Polyangiaceae bacterium]
MQARGFWTLNNVTDAELEAGLSDLLRAGAKTEARVVAHLAEMDARRLTLIGGQSLFEYCRARLGFSESEAWYRICAARTARRFPVVFVLLEHRELHLTAIALVAKYLTEENHLELLAEVRGKTKRQILELLVRWFPKADVASSLRKLSVPAGAVAAGPTGSLEPLSPQNYLLQLMTSSALQAKLELARDLMSHANPSGDLAVVVERAIDLLLEKLKARRFGQPKSNPAEVGRTERLAGEADADARPLAGERHAGGRSGPAVHAPAMVDELAAVVAGESVLQRKADPRKRRHVSHEMRRKIVARDGLCCSYVAPNGQRCRSMAFLEIDHKIAWSKGGPDSLPNLRVLCRAHNQLLAEREFGRTALAQRNAR